MSQPSVIHPDGLPVGKSTDSSDLATLQSLFADAATGWCLRDADGRFVAVNRAMAGLLGHSAEVSPKNLRNLAGRHPAELGLDAEDSPGRGLLQGFEEVLAGGGPLRLSALVQTPRGPVRYRLDVTALAGGVCSLVTAVPPMPAEAAEPVEAAGPIGPADSADQIAKADPVETRDSTALDGTAVPSAASSAASAGAPSAGDDAERYRRFFDLHSDALFFYDADRGRILDVNPGACEMYGFTREEFLTMYLQDISVEPAATLQALTERVTRIGRRVQRKRSGRVFTVEIACAYWTWRGQSVGVATVRDISQRVLNEQELTVARQHLEQRVAQRTAELSRTNLLLAGEIQERIKAQYLMRVQRDLGMALASSQNLDEVLTRTLKACLSVEGFDCGGIYLQDENGGGLRLATSRGLSPGFLSEASEYAPDSAQAKLVFSGAPYFGHADRLPVDRQRPEPGAMRAEGLRALAVLPVGFDGRIIACLNVASRSLDTIDDDIRSLLEGVAAQMGSVISRLTAQERLTRLAREKEAYRKSLESIFQCLPDAVVTVDRDLRIMDANKSFHDLCHALHMDPSCGVALPLECGGRCVEALRHTLATREIVRERRAECPGPGGVQRVVLLSTSPLVSEHESFSGAILSIRDITRLAELEEHLAEPEGFGKIVGKSLVMRQVFTTLRQVANHDSTVLLVGESGTGKELVADALHAESARAEGPLVKLNCATLSESLLESELFGHVRGAFTGAIRDVVGRFEAAEGGTIFLDEIGDISPRLQLKLLRFLETREFERVGQSRTRKADVRVVAATNVDLREKVAQGLFREDLFYRLKVMVLTLPPLRDRREDIPLLARHYLQHFGVRFGKRFSGLSDEVLEVMLRYPWPGNVRELKHALEHGCILCQGDRLELAHMPDELRGFDTRGVSGLRGVRDAGGEVGPPWSAAASRRGARIDPGAGQPEFRPAGERQVLLEALAAERWNKSRAARRLGISRKTLYRRLAAYGID